MLTLLTFIGKDNYNKLGTAFTTLLMMAVYADQVKSSTPEHVQYLTWIDSFILNNLIINVTATVSSCLMIWFEEREWEDLHLALGNATCYTQIPCAVFMNLSLVLIGFTEGAKEVADLKEANLLLVGLAFNLASILALIICLLYLYWSYQKNGQGGEGESLEAHAKDDRDAGSGFNLSVPQPSVDLSLTYASPPPALLRKAAKDMQGRQVAMPIRGEA